MDVSLLMLILGFLLMASGGLATEETCVRWGVAQLVGFVIVGIAVAAVSV